MEFTDKENEYKKIESPLEAVHMIQDELITLNYFVDALRTIGLPVADELQDCADNIHRLAKDCSSGISRETNGRYKDSQQATANMMNAIFAVTTLKSEEEH